MPTLEERNIALSNCASTVVVPHVVTSVMEQRNRARNRAISFARFRVLHWKYVHNKQYEAHTIEFLATTLYEMYVRKILQWPFSAFDIPDFVSWIDIAELWEVEEKLFEIHERERYWEW